MQQQVSIYICRYTHLATTTVLSQVQNWKDILQPTSVHCAETKRLPCFYLWQIIIGSQERFCKTKNRGLFVAAEVILSPRTPSSRSPNCKSIQLSIQNASRRLQTRACSNKREHFHRRTVSCNSNRGSSETSNVVNFGDSLCSNKPTTFSTLGFHGGGQP